MRSRDSLKLTLHGVLWRALYKLHLARLVQRGKCRLGIYHQYSPGSCGWCGKPHVKVNGKYFQETMAQYKALITEREAKNKLLTEALEFYAQQSTYGHIIEADNYGGRARVALTKGPTPPGPQQAQADRARY